jgi:hypothetical protein
LLSDASRAVTPRGLSTCRQRGRAAALTLPVSSAVLDNSRGIFKVVPIDFQAVK